MRRGGGGGGLNYRNRRKEEVLLYRSHTSTLTRIEFGINNISRVYHGIDYLFGFGLIEITRDIFENSCPYSGGGANVLSRDKACN